MWEFICVKSSYKVHTFMPNFCFKINTHEMTNIWKSRCYNKLEFSIIMKIHLKDQTKKMEEKKVETWPTKKPNIRKTLIGGWSTIDMLGAWHTIPFNEDGDNMVGYKFDVTRICSIEEPIRIRFCKKNHLNLEKERERQRAEAKHVEHYLCA